MSSPSDINKDVEPAGEIDEDRGDFWVGNPFKFPDTQQNLSSYEPNQMFLNDGKGRFIEIGYLSGTNTRADGRGALIMDLDNDLAPDLITRNTGGGAVQVYLNRFPKMSRVWVELRGTKSNSLGIGSLLSAKTATGEIHAQMYPVNNLYVQQASRVHFGLGEASAIDSLRIRWPSGTEQEIADIPGNTFVRVTEGNPELEIVFDRRATN